MADCPCLPGCPFFNDRLPIDSGIGSIYKKKYCQGDNSRCARWMIASTLGKPSVPADLYPNMVEKAEKILAEK